MALAVRPVPPKVPPRYVIREQIPSGGMAVVWLAQDTTTNQSVVVKCLPQEDQGDPVAGERLRREIDYTSRVDDSRTPQVYQILPDESGFVMECVGHQNLAQAANALPVGVETAVDWFFQMALCLRAVHAEGIVHRDVKPPNFVLGEDGGIRIIDFGIAKGRQADRVTTEGRVVGTVDYVSPEQALGYEAGSASDIYSLGICMFQLLTGKPPFTAENFLGLAMKHVREEIPDICTLLPGIPSGLVELVEACVVKDVDGRIELDALIECLAELQDSPAVLSAARRVGVLVGGAYAHGWVIRRHRRLATVLLRWLQRLTE
jgi:serine/threonine protein kinase